MEPSLLAKLISEFLGTFLLTIMFFITNGNPYLLGFTVGIIFLVLGPISGGLSNPALSLAIA